ncbi:MAG: hypothetical protein AB4426_22170 [Xenococcaceae cyanobacterium]
MARDLQRFFDACNPNKILDLTEDAIAERLKKLEGESTLQKTGA